MNVDNLIPWAIVALVAFVVLRMVLGVIKSSAKMMLWLVIAVIVFGGGFLFLQNEQADEQRSLPSLSIPADDVFGN